MMDGAEIPGQWGCIIVKNNEEILTLTPVTVLEPCQPTTLVELPVPLPTTFEEVIEVESDHLPKNTITIRPLLSSFTVRDSSITPTEEQPETQTHNTALGSNKISEERENSISEDSLDPSNTENPLAAKVGSEKEKQRRRKKGTPVCDECGKVFATPRSVRKHKMFSHNPNPPQVQCPACPLKFRHGRGIWKHYVKHHKDSNAPPLPNQIIQKLSTFEEGAQKLANFVPQGSLKCDLCDMDFSSEGNLRKHIHFLHGDGVKPGSHLKCDKCMKFFKQKATLDDHIRRVHEGKGFHCDLCPDRGDFQTAAKLWKHKVEKHGMTDLEPPGGVKVVECAFCGEKILRGLDTHVKKRHPQEYSTFKDRKPEVEVVVRIKTEEGRKSLQVPSVEENANMLVYLVRCPECSKEIQQGSMTRHLKNVHGIGNVKLFPCPSCGREFKERYHVWDHIREFHDEVKECLEASNIIKLVIPQTKNQAPTYKCAICTFQFSEKYQARTHLVTDHPEVYSSLENGNILEVIPNCPECSEQFHDNSELRLHVELTHPDKCWKCPICQKVMISPDELATHFKTKHKPKPKPKKSLKAPVPFNLAFYSKQKVSCEICSKQTTLRSILSHLKLKHKVSSHVKRCDACNKTFPTLTFWVMHMHTKHESHSLEDILIQACKVEEETFIHENKIKAKESRVKTGRRRSPRKVKVDKEIETKTSSRPQRNKRAKVDRSFLKNDDDPSDSSGQEKSYEEDNQHSPISE